MAELKTMYPGVANSPDTFLRERITNDGVIMYVADGAVFGTLPTLAVIGDGQLAETIKIVSQRSDGGYNIERGVEGAQRAWDKATTVARNWTNKDYEILRANITAINDGKVDKVNGKGLSTHDYDDAAKAKVDAIPPDPKYTDTVPNLEKYVTQTQFDGLTNDFGREIERIESQFATSIQFAGDNCANGIKTVEDTLTVDIQKKLNKTDVVNDLTTGGVDKALSAEQGKTLFMYADNGKKSIADAIVGKGVDATKSDDFNTLADKISKIKTGYGVGEEVSSENVEEVKVFHFYENESDQMSEYAKLEYTEDGKVVDIGEPSALVVGSFGQPFVATNNGKLFSFDEYLKRYYISSDTSPITAMSICPNNDLTVVYRDYLEIYRNNTGITTSTDKTSSYFMSCSVGSEQVNAMAAKYYYVYCGVGNKVVEVTNAFKKSWEFTEHTAQVNAVAVDKHKTDIKNWNIYSGGADNKVFKISPEGKKVWEFTLHTAAVNALAVDDEGYVYSGGADCTLYKISPEGKKVWENKTNNEITAIAIAPGGGVLCGTTGSTLYAFELDGTSEGNTELSYEDENGKIAQDGNIVDIVVANDASIFIVTKKEKMIYKMKYGEYKTSYKIIK